MECKVRWCTLIIIHSLGNLGRVIIVLANMDSLDLKEWGCTLWWCPVCLNLVSIQQVYFFLIINNYKYSFVVYKKLMKNKKLILIIKFIYQ